MKHTKKNLKRHVLDIEKEIRTFRNDILNSSKNEIDNLSILRDFFNLSELRDLIFHYKEHQFTIPKIKEALKELNFKFIGFENNKNLHDKFENFFKENKDKLDLNNWHEIEKSNPQLFIDMYQFWVQKN